MRILIFILLCSSFCNAGELTVEFYSKKLSIEYDESMMIEYKLECNDHSLKGFYNQLELSNYHLVLNALIKLRKALKLNDWFNFNIVMNTSKVLYKSKGENTQIAFCWFILNKMGYNSNIRYVGNKFTLYVYSNNIVYLTDSYNLRSKKFIQLKFREKEPANTSKVNNLAYFPNNKGEDFDFSLGEMPKIEPNKILEKKIQFTADGHNDSVTVNLNSSIVEMMVSYPHIENKEYFKIGFSEESSKTLVPFLKGKTIGLNKERTITYLLSFVRTGFAYKDDKDAFGRERPLIAEEVLYYPTSDCEDKSAIFFWLIKEILDLDMLVLFYPKHVNIAVLLDKTYGKPFFHRGKQYSVCEPNVLGDNEESGIGYHTQKSMPKVIFEYHPVLK